MAATHPLKQVFITGGTGYIGTRLCRKLLKRGHRVLALVRKGSEHKLVDGVDAVIANPFDATDFQDKIPAGSVFVQLLGVAHPSPSKAKQFREIDLRSVQASANAAAAAKVGVFIYVSVAMTPSRFMKTYQEIRRAGEVYCLDKNLDCRFVRPWYVLGPGHRWPLLLLPLYALAACIPSWRIKAKAMGLVTIKQMLNLLLQAIEEPSTVPQIVEINDIRKANYKNDFPKTGEY